MRSRRTPNLRPIQLFETHAVITLTKGYEAVIDVDDVGLVEGRNWSALVCKRRKAVYAVRVQRINGKSRMMLMHRVLSRVHDDLQIDHRDGNGLNNRRANLRPATHADNQLNKSVRSDSRSGLKGVAWNERDQIWRAEIMRGGKKKYLGNFKSAEDAHAAYIAVVDEFHGEFGRLK